jgi:AAA domain
MDDWGRYIEVVADELLGKPSSRTSKELRYGKRGSLKINLETGFWDDWESGESGGTLALIKREKGLEPAEAIEWMRSELKLDIEDRREGRARTPASPPQDEPAKPRLKPKLIATYDYVTESGELLFQVCRMEPKKFLQRRRPRDGDPPEDIKGGWIWKRDGITQVPYRLPELVEAIADERTIFVAEGEKDVNSLGLLGVPATCNAGGAGKWPDELTGWFKGADVVIIPDNDPQAKVEKTGELRWHPDGRPVLPGQDHAKLVASKLKDTAARIRVLQLPDLPLKGDASDWIAAGGTSAALYSLVEEQAISPEEYQRALDDTFKPKQFVSKFGAVVWGQPRGPRVRYEYVVKGLIPRRETILIYGMSQSGKSFFTQALGMAVARGVDFCGRRVRQGLVIYCAAEAGIGFADLRMEAYRVDNGMPLDQELPFVCLTRKFDLFGDVKQAIDLIAECRYWKDYFARLGFELEAVVIDTLNKVTPAMDEIHGKDVGIVLDRLDLIRNELNTGLWLVHHMNAAGTGPRGHTSLYAAFETALRITRSDEREKCSDGIVREVRHAIEDKQREGEDGKRYPFCLRGVRLGRQDDDGDELMSAVVEWIGKGMATSKDDSEPQGAALTDQRRVVYRALKRAVEEFGVPPPPQLSLPRSVIRVVDVKRWRDVYRGWQEEASDAAIRKALGRGSDFLLNRGLIGRENPWVWIVPGKKVKGETQAPPPPSDEPPETQSPSTEPDWESMTQSRVNEVRETQE